eukprot:tig00022075_g23600.t1
MAARQAQQEAERRARHPALRAQQEAPEIYDPWGKAGAGAPIRDAAGNIIANRRAQQPGAAGPAPPGPQPPPPQEYGYSGYPQAPDQFGYGAAPPGRAPPGYEAASPGGGAPAVNPDDHSRFKFEQQPTWVQDEMRRKAKAQSDMQAALQEQMEEKKRQKEAEKRRQEEEDRRLEAKLQKEREELARREAEEKEKEAAKKRGAAKEAENFIVAPAHGRRAGRRRDDPPPAEEEPPAPAAAARRAPAAAPRTKRAGGRGGQAGGAAGAQPLGRRCGRARASCCARPAAPPLPLCPTSRAGQRPAPAARPEDAANSRALKEALEELVALRRDLRDENAAVKGQLARQLAEVSQLKELTLEASRARDEARNELRRLREAIRERQTEDNETMQMRARAAVLAADMRAAVPGLLGAAPGRPLLAGPPPSKLGPVPSLWDDDMKSPPTADPLRMSGTAIRSETLFVYPDGRATPGAARVSALGQFAPVLKQPAAAIDSPLLARDSFWPATAPAPAPAAPLTPPGVAASRGGTAASFDLEGIQRRNEARLQRLGAMQAPAPADEVDTLLNDFLTRKKGNRAGNAWGGGASSHGTRPEPSLAAESSFVDVAFPAA